jgi:hypothetical protein
MMVAKLHGYDENLFCCDSNDSNAYADVDCLSFRNSCNEFLDQQSLIVDFTFKPEGIDEAAGSYQDTPIHLRGLKDFELEFLTLRNKRSHRIHRCE